MAGHADPRLGRRLRQLRTERGLSQTELAAPNFTHAYISSIESGRRSPSPRVLRHLAEKLGVTADELVTGQPAGLKEHLELVLQDARRLLSSGAVDAARKAYQEVLDQATELSLDRHEAKARFGLAHCEERLGHWEEAIDRFEEAEEFADGRFTDIHADIVAGKARCIEILGDRSHAMYLLDRTVRDLRRRGIEDPLTLMKLYAPLSLSACEAGFYSQAAEAAAYVLSFEPSVEDPLTLATSHINVARTLLQQNEYETALRSLHRAEELFDQLELRLELGRAHLAQGIVLARKSHTDAANHLRRAMKVFEAADSEVDKARTLVELGRVERLEENPNDAVPLLERAIELLRRIGDVAELALAHRELALAVGTTDDERAEKNLHEAIALFERSEAPLQVALTYRFLGELQAATGNDPCEAFRNAAFALPVDL